MRNSPWRRFNKQAGRSKCCVISSILILLGIWTVAVYRVSAGPGSLHVLSEKLRKGAGESLQVTERSLKEALYQGKIQRTRGAPELPPIEIIFDQDPRRLTQQLFALGKNPVRLAQVLDSRDPYGVQMEDPSQFRCPPPHLRLTNPDLSSRATEDLFKSGGGLLFFQHMRKAGGTAFCDLTRRNMPQKQVPHYYCMPGTGTLATPPWNNITYLQEQIHTKGWRMVANEWDALPESHLSMPNTLYTTMLRHPVDRWFSVYRFEHMENRDNQTGKWQRGFGEWYRSMSVYTSGHNYYIKTLLGGDNPPAAILEKDVSATGKPRYKTDLYWTYKKHVNWGQQVKWDAFQRVTDRLLRMSGVYILEWLEYSDRMIERQTGWKQPPRRVLPHERHAKRLKDGQKYVSASSKDTLTPEEWWLVASYNAYDTLLYNWAKRVFLERYVCDNLQAVSSVAK